MQPYTGPGANFDAKKEINGDPNKELREEIIQQTLNDKTGQSTPGTGDCKEATAASTTSVGEGLEAQDAVASFFADYGIDAPPIVIKKITEAIARGSLSLLSDGVSSETVVEKGDYDPKSMAGLLEQSLLKRPIPGANKDPLIEEKRKKVLGEDIRSDIIKGIIK